MEKLSPWRFFWTAMLGVAACFLALGAAGQDLLPPLPPLQAHPLPPSLARWQGPEEAGDYFAQVQPTPAGYLVWSEFPLRVYLHRPPQPEGTAAEERLQQWARAVRTAMEEWGTYLPLVEVPHRQGADIVIEASLPPIGATFNPETGQMEIPRARSAQTRYQFYRRETNPPILSHRITVQIAPGLSGPSTLSAARHELGHALGIWGHSPSEKDALYFSQVGHSPPISVRDVNTLKKVYQQPTRLGWALPEGKSELGVGK